MVLTLKTLHFTFPISYFYTGGAVYHKDDWFLQVSFIKNTGITLLPQPGMLPTSTERFQKGDFLLPSLSNFHLQNSLRTSTCHSNVQGVTYVHGYKGGALTFALSRMEPFPSTDILAPVSS